MNNLQELIKNEIKKNLKVKMTSDYNGYVEAELLYDGEIISRNGIFITTDSNPLDEQELDKSVNSIVISKKRLAELLRKEQKLSFLENGGGKYWEEFLY